MAVQKFFIVILILIISLGMQYLMASDFYKIGLNIQSEIRIETMREDTIILKDFKPLDVDRLIVECEEYPCTLKDSKGNIEILVFDTLVRAYYEGGKKVLSEQKIENGIGQGFFKLYYKNGNIFIESFIVNNRREGISKQFHKNGIISSMYEYKNNELNGITRSYNSKGIVKVESLYRNGIKCGLWKYYSNKSKLIETVQYLYENEDELRCIKKYDKKGRIKMEKAYKNWVGYGVWKWYNKKGELRRTKKNKAVVSKISANRRRRSGRRTSR